jgi:hypothetical protein
MTPANALITPIFAHGFYLSPGQWILLCLYFMGPFVLAGLLVLAAVALRFWRPTAAGVCLLLAAPATLTGCYVWLVNGPPGEPLESLLFRPEFRASFALGVMSILAGVLSSVDVILLFRQRAGGSHWFILALTVVAAGLAVFLGNWYFILATSVETVVVEASMLFLAVVMSVAGAVLVAKKKPGAWLCWLLATLPAGFVFVATSGWDAIVRLLAQ